MNLLRRQDGVIMIGAFIVVAFFMVVSLALAEFAVHHYSDTKRTLLASNTLDAADAGADDFMYQINQSSTYQGTTNAPTTATNSCSGYTSSPVTLVNNAVQGKVTYESCVANGSISDEKIVYVTAKTYLPATATSPTLTRKLRLVIHASSSGAAYTVQTGNGGLYLTNNASIGAGDVYLNGRLRLDNNATIGDSTGQKDSHVWVAGYGCGSGASYPQLCPGTTGQSDLPIYAYNAHIYADVHAPNMTNNNWDTNTTLANMTNSGLVDANAPQVAMPDDNRATVMARNTWTTQSASTAGCPNGQKTSTWPAGTHFTGGNINVSGNCQITVMGDIWIDGSLQLSNSASLKVGSSVTIQPNILIDGQGGFKPSNNTSIIANSSGVAFRINTYWSYNGSCSTTCTTPTGSNLQTSQNTPTIVFSNAFNGAGSTFDAVWSEIHVSNNANIGQLIGQYVVLDNNGSVIFSGTGASSSGTPIYWNVSHYEQIYN